MSSVQVGDVVRVHKRFGPRRASLRRVCPACHCYVSQGAIRCTKCQTEFAAITHGYAQVISLGRS